MTHLTLTIALSHAISFLTKPLVSSVATKTIDILRQQLEIRLREEFASTWFPDQPQRGSNTRCMTLSPARLPPRALLAACFAARFPWSQWMEALGKFEFQLFIDPGSVSVLRRGEKTHRIVWSSSTYSGIYDVANDDDDMEEVFSMINRKVIASDAWLSPTQPSFQKTFTSSPTSSSNGSRLDAAFFRSRCASRLSNSSGSDDGAYESDAFSAPPSLVETASLSSVSSRASSPAPVLSSCTGKYVPPARRGAAISTSNVVTPASHGMVRKRNASNLSDDIARVAREENVVVDTTKAKLTVYAGKTTVMSGGVMLSAATRARA